MAKSVVGARAGLLVGVCAGLVLACGGKVGAQGFPETLPRAEFREEIRRLSGDVGPTGSLYVPESDTYTGNRNHDGHLVAVSAFVGITSLQTPAFSGPMLRVSGSSVNGGPSEAGYANESVMATAEVTYYFRVVAAPTVGNIPIILPVHWSARLSIDNDMFGSAGVQWEAAINPQLNRFRGSDDDGRFFVVNSAFGVAPISDSGVVNLTVNARNHALEGEYYRVHLLLRGGASRYVTASDFGRNSAGFFDATLDPLPYVDPAFATNNLVEIFYSENLFQGTASASSPEAGSLALIVHNALVLGFVGLQRRGRKTRPVR